jgi:AcrR family transcriptional regulator
MDPRVAKTHAAVMQAATDLLVEGGPQALTVDAVVARSGVAKTTVYRHWDTRDRLVMDVISDCAPNLHELDPDLSVPDALRQLARQMVALIGEPRWRRPAPATVLLKAELEGMADLDQAMKAEQTRVVGDLFRRGVGEGVLRADVLDDLDRSITLLAGPIVMAGMVESTALDDELARRAVDQFLAANRP